MSRPIARADALALLAPFRANDWPRLAEAAAKLGEGDRALAALVRAFALAAMAPADGERLRALDRARAGLPALARHGFVLPILGLDPASLRGIAIALDRLLTYAAADAFLLEYPKCGRTWLRMMIGRAVARAGGPALPDPTDLGRLWHLRRDLPRLEVTHDDDPELKRVEDIARDKDIYGHCRVLLQVRDPRDVVVSYFFHRTTRNHETFPVEPFTGSLAAFVRHPQGGIPNIVAFYNAWAAGRAAPAALLRIDYEDLVADPAAGLTAALAFLGLPAPDPAGIAATVEECRFERMQALESAGAIPGRRLATADPDNPESRKVRRGKVGGYRDYLAADDIAWIDAYLERHLDRWFGRYIGGR